MPSPARTPWLALCLVVLSGSPGAAQAPRRAAVANELDAFMEKVLARREVNRQTLKEYVLDEEEEFEILGPGRARIHRTERDFTWYVRDGLHVRSPVRFGGVSVGEEARQRYEDAWIKRERGRQERRAKREKEKEDKKASGKGGESEVVITPGGVEIGAPGVPTEPRFVSEAYFMDFKFEPGNYYLAGREKLEGKEVLRIEYYPERMFGDADDDAVPEPERQKRREERQKQSPSEKEFEQQIERRMNKTALITLWVDPTIHQIVKYTFDNVWLDFLPAAWLVRVDDLHASMTMGQPFEGVWLPREMNIHAGVTLALGSFEASYGRKFSDYRQADVKSRITVPKREEIENDALEIQDVHELPGSGPFVGDETQTQETIGEIRVHGNTFVTDEEVMQIAAISVGQTLAANGIEGIERRLKASGRFDTVEVRKRYRSLAMTDVAIVLLVHERAGVRSVTLPDGTPRIIRINPFRRIANTLMFLPILNYADGYGFTYGARVSTVDLLGAGERLSVPLSWGGLRRAALEFERQFKRGPLTRVTSSVAIWQRENPRFEIDDRRVELKARAERALGDIVRLGVEGSRSTVSFDVLDDKLWTVGANVELDTRGEPAFPGNAVLLGAAWTGLHVTPGFTGTSRPRINRYTTDARGYLRVVRQAVIAGRALYTAADATLPPYERLLMGGSSTLRGFRTGTFDGDRMLVTSAELRVPITSVISGAKLGFTAFFDAGKAWDFDARMQDAVWHRGAGAGVFLLASVVRLNLNVARGLNDGDTRVHLSSGFSF